MGIGGSFRTLFFLTSILLASCSSKDCKYQKEIPPFPGEEKVLDKKKTGTVKVFKSDESRQCQGGGIPIEKMQEELEGINIIDSHPANDGKMRIQVCGAATGNINVFEINHEDLEKAQRLGFKKLD